MPMVIGKILSVYSNLKIKIPELETVHLQYQSLAFCFQNLYII